MVCVEWMMTAIIISKLGLLDPGFNGPDSCHTSHGWREERLIDGSGG